METPNNPVVSGSTATSSGLTGGVSIAIPGWDEPLTEEELEAIDASVEAASAGRAPNHKKRRPPEAEDSRIETPRRRLPRSSSLSPCQVNEVMRYPSMAFGGRILYSRTTVEVEKSAAELLKKINALKRLTDQVTIGFDIEWRPTFRRGAPLRKAAVMQICCNTDDCYVMHIVHSNIPQSLKLILEDRAVIKVGVGIVNDAVKVQKDYNVSVQACEDLSWLANEKLHHDQRNWSLAHLTEILVSKQVLKSLPDLETNNSEIDNKKEAATSVLL
ncbi:Werner Syndrome-like exonuclease isoform X2 [Punica granatum]|uniref:3'-5' exonuclease n=1 Tax=Punica granatum TaxID=22663 RepID=A0A6P8EL35_PUNGR|nr:Werner Syndrome-like exonuclease isoform X2 [Punica granatum]